jgi:DNA polymerase-1
LILQVHDELILEVADEEDTYVTALLKEEMEEVVKLSVPLPVSVSKAKDWYHL